MTSKYTVTVPEGGARHALPGMGLISIREDMPDHLIEVFIENGVTQYFEKKADSVEPETNKADEQTEDSGTAGDTTGAGTTALPGQSGAETPEEDTEESEDDRLKRKAQMQLDALLKARADKTNEETEEADAVDTGFPVRER